MTAETRRWAEAKETSSGPARFCLPCKRNKLAKRTFTLVKLLLIITKACFFFFLRIDCFDVVGIDVRLSLDIDSHGSILLMTSQNIDWVSFIVIISLCISTANDVECASSNEGIHVHVLVNFDSLPAELAHQSGGVLIKHVDKVFEDLEVERGREQLPP